MRLEEAIKKLITKACSRHFDIHNDISIKKISRSKGLDLMIENVNDSTKAINDYRLAELPEKLKHPDHYKNTCSCNTCKYVTIRNQLIQDIHDKIEGEMK